MKPLYLRMKAFGPFAETADVSFERVFDGGLFLIHGRTGAGKTSLLDGLCFSLFGRPSSEEREKDLRALRSDLATIETMTETELIFTIGPVAYRVHRVPTQSTPKKRGEGLTEHKGSAELYRYNGTVEELRSQLNARLGTNATTPEFADLAWEPIAGKVEAVDEAIENLVGMNEQQFRQVVILPQGRFREFLSSSSTERQLILEKLFQTDRFSRLQQYISGLKRSTEARLVQAGENLQSRLAHFGLNDFDDIAPRRDALATTSDVETAKLETARTRAEALSQELNLAKESEMARQRFAALTKETAALAARNDEIERTRTRVQTARAWMPFFQVEDQRASTARKIQDLGTRRALLLANQETLVKKNQQAAERQKSLLAQQPSLEEIANERARLRELVPALKEIASTTRQIETDREFSAKIEQEIESLQKKVHDLAENQTATLHLLFKIDEDERGREATLVETEDRRIKELELHFHHSEAARLAEQLSPGSPCPVCGSAEHPKPANRIAMAPTKNGPAVTAALIQDERQKFEKLRQQLAEQRLGRQSRLEPLVHLRAIGPDKTPSSPSKIGFAALFQIYDEQSKTRMKMEQAIAVHSAELKTKVAALENLRRRLDEKQSAIPAADRSLENVMKRGLELKTEQERREPELSKVAAELQEIANERSRLEGSLAALVDENERLERERGEIEKKLESLRPEGSPPVERLAERDVLRLQTEIEVHIQAQARNAAALHEVEQQIQRVKSSRAVDEISNELAAASRERTELEQHTARLRVEIEGLTKLELEATQARTGLEKLKDEAARASRMSALLTGDKTQNKLLVPLSRFVLQSRFEDVLDQANRRLARMSRGQFQLRRPALSRNLRDSQGLELTVEDSVAGKERHAGSLSGGESFMAALSLALGLADVVQADLGGVRLDSVLIDEGFGTLDSESLDLAMKTLVDLQAGGRIVGIISHVQELKSQVHHQLEVQKTTRGSRADWNRDISP